MPAHTLALFKIGILIPAPCKTQHHDIHHMPQYRPATNRLSAVSLAETYSRKLARLLFSLTQSSANPPVTTLHRKILPDTAWSYDGRGPKLGAWGSLMATFPAMLEKRKIHGLTALVECNNWQAFDAHRSLRFEATALRASLSLFGWHRCYYYKSKGAFWCTIPTTVSDVELCR